MVPARAILELGDAFYDPVVAARFPEHRLRFRNDRAARTVGLDTLSHQDWVGHFGRFEPLTDSLLAPLALRYHGHQFRTYNPDLGDGRGFLFAQLRDDRDRLLDLGTKGSGQTPYSRFGDGRLTLKGGIREVLATEMLEALGVETSRTFSLIETGEELERGDEPSPTRSAVLVRLSHSHIRYGMFQRLAYLKKSGNILRLTDYVLRHYFPDADASDPVSALMDAAVGGAARQAAGFMAAGFVHGVLNTDNINITGESFDYGPYRFAPTYDLAFTAAYFDQQGLYAFGRQAEAFHWNLHQLALALRTIAEPASLVPAFAAYPARFEAELRTAILRRLGIMSQGEGPDIALLAAMEAALTETQISLDRFWFDWRGGRLRKGLAEAPYDHPAFAPFVSAVADYASASVLSHPYWADTDPCGLLIGEIEAIWDAIAERDDWGPFEAKVVAIRRMGAALAS